MCLWLGLFPRRRGQTPYCRKCGYNLTGAVALRCTECGADLRARRAVVRGERRRRRWLIGLGCVLGVGFLGLGTVTGIRAARSIDLYRYAPLWWVVGDLQGGPAAVRSRAIRELERRWTADLLKKEDCAAFVDLLLAEQQNWPPTPGVTDRAINLLGVIISASAATEAQAERFLVNFVRLDLRTRPRVRVGAAVPYQIEAASAGPDAGFEAVVTTGEVRIGGEGSRVRTSSTFILSSALARSARTGTKEVALDPGEHEATCDVKVEIYATGPGSVVGIGADRADRPLRVYGRTLGATFAVVDADTAGDLATVNDPAIEGEMRRRLAVDWAKLERSGPTEPMRLNVQINAQAGLPATVAGELIGEFDDGREQRLGLVRLRANSTGQIVTVGETCPEPWPRRVKVRLVPSAEAAEESVDIREYWGGTIEFGSFEVESPADGG